jgi:two-component system response regulator HydG
MHQSIGRHEWRILIVDDDAEFGHALAEGLEALGWRAFALRAASPALPLLKTGRCDVLVTDLRMPGIDGRTLLNYAREHAPALPVLVMTAFSAVDAAIECVERGAFHYLTKPFKVAELDLILQRALTAPTLRERALTPTSG